MENLFTILVLLSLIALVIALVKPSIFKRLKPNWGRKQFALIFGCLLIFSFIGFGRVYKPIPKEETAKALPDQVSQETKQSPAETTTPLETPKVTAVSVESSPTPSASPTTKVVASPKATTTTVAAKVNCDPSYPTVCIPPPPPDLDCKDITYRNFKVLSPDPHNFDGKDKDGIGCES